MKRLVTLCLLLLGLLPANAQYSGEAVQDETARVTVAKFIAPVTLITIGSLGVGVPFMVKGREWVRDNVGYCYVGGRPFKADDYIQFLPLAMDLGLGAIGVKARHSFKDRFLVSATAYASMAIMVNAVKYSVCEMRPDNSSANSFPSGHTATAFTAAEIVRVEYGPWWGLGAYAISVATACLRVYNNRHWVNDLLAGAGFGILSAHIGYWLLPLENRAIDAIRSRHASRKDIGFLALPMADPFTRSAGLSIAMSF